jgi:formate-dependent phosphoribosylglycinamide formyltransferase (GAR transformylase)
VHEPSLFEAVRRVQQRERVDRLEATVEAHVMPAARVREACGIPGTSTRTAFLCRDKPAMKDALRAAGVPTARSAGVRSRDELWTFVREVGLPVILKPRDAAGAAGAHRITSPEELERAAAASGLDRGAPAAAEEFVEGHEGFFDTLTIGGQVVQEFITHYYPNVLEAMRARWISPVFITTNRLDAPGYRELKDLGRRVVRELGIGTSATHMEWFFGPKGLKVSEIGARPPGESLWDLYSVGNEVDLQREWARALLTGRVGARLTRRFATGSVQVRPDREGRIAAYAGLEAVRRQCGPWIWAHELPRAGRRTVPIEKGYLANAWFRLKHPDYDELRRMMDFIGRTLKVRAAA